MKTAEAALQNLKALKETYKTLSGGTRIPSAFYYTTGIDFHMAHDKKVITLTKQPDGSFK